MFRIFTAEDATGWILSTRGGQAMVANALKAQGKTVFVIPPDWDFGRLFLHYPKPL